MIKNKLIFDILNVKDIDYILAYTQVCEFVCSETFALCVRKTQDNEKIDFRYLKC